MLTRLLMILVCCATLFGCGEEVTEPAAGGPAAASQPTPTPTMARKPSPPGAMVYIISPADGEEVRNPVTVVFGLKGASIAPAGIDLPNTGHHHLIVDRELVSMDLTIPADAQHIHFGLGQTETSVDLAPGEHVLQLVLGDYLHRPHEPPLLSEPVRVRVVE
ncbi:MAG: DUF4399 domain-containing protein [Gammaproteobacteria bacterium]|nr:DUF4399 domain-containing protein [Gammaproteobacteria bacterium]